MIVANQVIEVTEAAILGVRIGVEVIPGWDAICNHDNKTRLTVVLDRVNRPTARRSGVVAVADTVLVTREFGETIIPFWNVCRRSTHEERIKLEEGLSQRRPATRALRCQPGFERCAACRVRLDDIHANVTTVRIRTSSETRKADTNALRLSKTHEIERNLLCRLEACSAILLIDARRNPESLQTCRRGRHRSVNFVDVRVRGAAEVPVQIATVKPGVTSSRLVDFTGSSTCGEGRGAEVSTVVPPAVVEVGTTVSSSLRIERRVPFKMRHRAGRIEQYDYVRGNGS